MELLIAYGALQAFFIAIILMRQGSKSTFKTLFAFLLIIEAVTLMERLLVESDLIRTLSHLIGISYPISFLKPPLMFFMALSITRSKFSFHLKSIGHLIPFILILIMNLQFYSLSGQEKIVWVNNFMEKIPSFQSFDFYFTLSFFFYIGIYILISIKLLGDFRKHTRNNLLVNWYRHLLILYTCFLSLHLIYFVMQPITESNMAFINQASMLAMAFLIQSVAYVLISRSSQQAKAVVPDEDKSRQMDKDYERILHRIKEDKVYLDDQLNIKKFSEELSLPEKYVSNIINGRFNCSFKRLINEYRIEEAKKLMNQAKEKKIKLAEIGYRSGFNNKVSFYRSFRVFENLSPSEYFEKIS